MQTRKEGNRHGDRSHRLPRGKGKGIQEFIPGKDKYEDRRGSDPWCGKREKDPKEDLERCTPIHTRRPKQLVRDLPEDAPEDPDGEGKGEGGVRKNKTAIRIPPSQPSDQQVEGAHGSDGGKHGDGKGQDEQKVP